MTQSAAVVEMPAAPVLRALNPRTLSIDIVLPVLNEAHVIARSVSTLHAYLSQHVPHRWRIIIADNGSTDGTAEAARQLEVRYPEVQLIQLTEKGRGRALKQAWLQSSADILAYMDIDLSTNLDSFVPMITPLIMGEAAVATGSRLMKQSRTTGSGSLLFLLSQLTQSLTCGALPGQRGASHDKTVAAAKHRSR